MTDRRSNVLPFVRPRRRRKLVEASLELQVRSAREAGALGFFPRLLILANLPYRPVPGKSYSRRAGRFWLGIEATERRGLPFGRYPRLLLAWAATEAVRTRRRRLEIGPSFTAFLRRLGIGSSGGRHGPLHRVQDQMERLFTATVYSQWGGGGNFWEDGYRVGRRTFLWWESGAGGDATLDGSFVLLSADFLEEVLKAPVPIDLRVFRALFSPLAIDVYCWLRYRTFRLSRPYWISWEKLHEQFGTQTPRLAEFRRSFRQALAQVLILCPELRVRQASAGVCLLPCRTGSEGAPRR